MQPIEFKVVGLSMDVDAGEVRLEAKTHQYLTSMLFLKVEPGQMEEFSMGETFTLARKLSTGAVENIFREAEVACGGVHTNVPGSIDNPLETVPLSQLARQPWSYGQPAPEDEDEPIVSGTRIEDIDISGRGM